MAITPDGTHAYVANAGTDSVSVIETATNTVTAEVPVGVEPEGVAITPDGTRAYVANGCFQLCFGDRHGEQHRDCDRYRWEYSLGVAIRPDGTRAYVANENSNSVSVIDTASNTVVATVAVGSGPTGWPSPRELAHPATKISARKAAGEILRFPGNSRTR